MKDKLELIQALFEVQKELHASKIVKDSKAHQWKYVKLSTLLEFMIPILHKYGLFIDQGTNVVNDKEVLQLKIIHKETGQYTESLSFLAQDWDDYKAWGGENTYKRRYMLMGKLGITPAEDTSETATYTKKYNNDPNCITDAQARMVYAKTKDKPNKRKAILDKYGSTNKIPKDELDGWIEWIDNGK